MIPGIMRITAITANIYPHLEKSVGKESIIIHVAMFAISECYTYIIMSVRNIADYNYECLRVHIVSKEYMIIPVLATYCT